MRRLSASLVSTTLVGLEVASLLVAERRSPMRAPRETMANRVRLNGVLGGIALAATALLETPIVSRVATIVERRGWGILPRTRLPPVARALLAIVLFDYGMYAWHAALHRVPLLWRLHVVHHADRDCDTSTAVRIHALEIAISIGVRVLQVVAIGASPEEFALWQSLFGASVIFHHANVTLPGKLERLLGSVVMTPRRHGLHHLADREAQGGNWSAGLIVWDRLHGTLRDAGDPRDVVGLPAYASASDVTLAKMFALPFAAQPDPWHAR